MDVESHKLQLVYFRYDLRGKSVRKALHWHDENKLQTRASYEGSDGRGTLTISNMMSNDKGQYRCRVDFNGAPTRVSLITLSAICKFVI